MQILQLSTALPRNEYSTEDLIRDFPCRLPDDVKQNVLNLGVSKRCLVSRAKPSIPAESVLAEDGIADLCTGACKEAIEKAGLSVEDIDYFVAAYDATPFLSPGLSQLLVPKLGLDPYIKLTNAQGIASTAFPKALDLAQYYLAMHPNDYALVCISGVSSYWFQNQVNGIADVLEIRQISEMKDEALRRLELRKWIATMEYFLFGDGAAAAILAKKEEGLAIKKIVEVTNLRRQDYMAGYARLSALDEPFKFGFCSYLGKEIPSLGTEYTGLALRKLLGSSYKRITKAAKKWAVHTGSEKILRTLAEHHEIEASKLEESYNVLREHGNLAGASLPFILERIISGSKLSKGDIVLMIGYGWGFSAAASLLQNV